MRQGTSPETDEQRQTDVVARATSLLRQERLAGRRLTSSEIRTITKANKLLIASGRELYVQNQASIAAFESELRLSLARFHK
jgi:hypothetical protein